MTVLRVILADQLSAQLEVVARAEKGKDVFLLAEVMAEAIYVRHHVKKIAFQFSAMRHFAEALKSAGYKVRYVGLEDDGNSQSLGGEILRAVEALRPSRILITEPGEWRLRDDFEALQLALPVPFDILPDTRFLCSHAEFEAWAVGRRELRMEYFYREMRRRHHLLMEPDGKPSGGRWNYDAENRKPPRAGLDSPRRLSFRKDAITLAVLDLGAATLTRQLRAAGALSLRGDEATGPARAGPLHRAHSPWLWRLSGRDGQGRALFAPLAASGLHQCRAALPAGSLPQGRRCVSRGPCPAQRHRGLHPADSGLA